MRHSRSQPAHREYEARVQARNVGRLPEECIGWFGGRVSCAVRANRDFATIDQESQSDSGFRRADEGKPLQLIETRHISLHEHGIIAQAAVCCAMRRYCGRVSSTLPGATEVLPNAVVSDALAPASRLLCAQRDPRWIFGDSDLLETMVDASR
jgi:hypothetical protein